jgi:hypothetical protein
VHDRVKKVLRPVSAEEYVVFPSIIRALKVRSIVFGEVNARDTVPDIFRLCIAQGKTPLLCV